ncbi:MAG: type II toxin-antitoxin system RelE/ParE family toxin [Bacteroidales bacterium]|nr:type II toxin-antitoxin system RelE/ParE family toxin [Bacteroidales bacterium]
MKRTIMTYGGYFERFIMTLTLNERRKIDYILSLLETEDRLPVKFIKHIAQGIYELRINVNGLAHRVFFIFDDDSIVILFNGFTKKSMKTPRYEIERAIRLKKEYYADKRSQNKEL